MNNDNIKERIDIAFANGDWRLFFPNSIVRHLDFGGSDHAPICLNLLGSRNNYPKQFHFLAMWANSGDCVELIRQHWESSTPGSTAFQISNKLKKLKEKLKKWNKESFEVLEEKKGN